jgi:hypothetical protein
LSAKVKIDGIEYDFPRVDTLTLDEAQTLYEHSGLTLDAIGELPENTFHPGFIKGMLYIAVHRARPELKRVELDERLGTLKLSEMGEVFTEEPDDASPPEQENEEPPERSGETGDDGSEISPEPASPDSSGEPVSVVTSASDPLISAR